MLNNDRAVLYDRIDKRVDAMFDAGLVEEVTALRDKGYSRNLVSMQGIGYKEIYASLDGEYDLDRARYIINGIPDILPSGRLHGLNGKRMLPG